MAALVGDGEDVVVGVVSLCGAVSIVDDGWSLMMNRTQLGVARCPADMKTTHTTHLQALQPLLLAPPRCGVGDDGG